LELIKDYDLGINYHPRKANVVADALSQRSHVSQLVVDSMPFEWCEDFDKLNLRIVVNTEAMEMKVGSSLLHEIRRGQLEDEKVQEIKRNIKEEKSPGFSEDNEGVLWYKVRIYVPCSQGHLLVVRNEKRRCGVCCPLRHLSASQSQASMTC
jgi:hypothetical protein